MLKHVQKYKYREILTMANPPISLLTTIKKVQIQGKKRKLAIKRASCKC